LLKRILLTLFGAFVLLALVVGVEIVIALRRDYLPTEPVLEIGGSFGDVSAESLRFSVLGDSTGAGVGAGDAEHAYPTLLAERLAALGYRVELSSHAVSGARVADVLNDQVPRAAKDEPDLVFVAIGANDVTHVTRLAEIREDMEAAIGKLRATGATVVVAGAPDMRAAAFLEPLRSIAGWRGRQVADAVADAARAMDVPLVPLAEKTARFFVEDPDDSYSDDLFHPGPAGYRRWADAIFPYLEDALEGER
jgi:lysophospholipase L1-like esterase